MIEYRDSLDGVTPDMLDSFFTDWPKRPDNEMLFKCLAGSYKVWLAFDEGRLIGFVSAVSDGIFCAFVTYLEVLPDYRKHGIGTELMRMLEESVIHLNAAVLQCGEDVVPFYCKIGYGKGIAMYKHFDSNRREKRHDE